MDTLGFRERVESELDKLVDTDLEDLPREVNLLKVRLELFLYVYNIKNNIKIAESLSTSILEKHIHIIDESYDINEFFDCQQRVQDTPFFAEPLISRLFGSIIRVSKKSFKNSPRLILHW